jgi:xanthine permease XanP
MAERPQSLIYGVDDKPPLLTLLVLGVQHIVLMSSTLVLPVVLIAEIGGSFEQVRVVVSLSMIACGVGTLAQAMRLPGFGSGFLCPNLVGPNFFGALMQAAWLGGMPLMRGMTIAAGLSEAIFARFVQKLRFLFPPEITGLVVLMVAESLIPLGTSKFLGITYKDEPISRITALVALLTLCSMVAVNAWGRGKLRLYGVAIGLLTGYALSMLTGLFGSDHLQRVYEAPWAALPYYPGMTHLSFRWSLLPIFLIVSATGALKTMGNLIMCQKVNDSEWKEPEMGSISGGLMADALAVTVSGVIGGMASDTSASNVGLSSSSGATSRTIGYVAGGLFVLLGFFPKIGALLSVMPMPVMGAILIFVTSYMLLSGLQIILGSGVDTRKIFTIGVALIFGLSLDILPELYAGIQGPLRFLFDSPLTLATAIAVLLNQVLPASAAAKPAAAE